MVDAVDDLLKRAWEELCRLTAAYDYENFVLSGTGARIIFVPNRKFIKDIPLRIWDMGIAAKPEKYYGIAAWKAGYSLQHLEPSIVARDPTKDQYAGGIPLSNNAGAIGLSGFREIDDHFVLGILMKKIGLLSDSRARDDNHDVVDDYHELFRLAEEAKLPFDMNRIRQFEEIVGIRRH